MTYVITLSVSGDRQSREITSDTKKFMPKQDLMFSLSFVSMLTRNRIKNLLIEPHSTFTIAMFYLLQTFTSSTNFILTIIQSSKAPAVQTLLWPELTPYTFR